MFQYNLPLNHEQGGKDPPDLQLLDIDYINDIGGVRVDDHITPAGVHGN